MKTITQVPQPAIPQPETRLLTSDDLHGLDELLSNFDYSIEVQGESVLGFVGGMQALLKLNETYLEAWHRSAGGDRLEYTQAKHGAQHMKRLLDAAQGRIEQMGDETADSISTLRKTLGLPKLALFAALDGE